MKKQWLITLVGLTLALAAITGGGLALAGNGSDIDDQDVADGWKLVEASGWPGGFSLRLPQGWQLNEHQGIDSYVGEIVWGSGRLTFDFGWYSSSLVDDDDPQYIVTYEEIGGRRAKLVRTRAEGDGLITGGYFEDFDGSNPGTLNELLRLFFPPHPQNRLQISGVGLTPDQQETALAVFRTIRPLVSESQPTEELEDGETGLTGDQPVRSDDDIDPNVCNLVHNINACSPEELEAGRDLTDETGEGAEIVPGSQYGDPEPLFVDGEPGYIVQSLEEAVIEDCSLAGGTVYVTSEGELGCEVVHDLEDDSDELVTFSQPPTIEPLPIPAPR